MHKYAADGSMVIVILTEVRVLLLGLALDEPFLVLGMMRLLATSTTSLPLNFFSSSRTNLC